MHRIRGGTGVIAAAYTAAVFTSMLAIVAAFLVAANVRHGGWLMAPAIGALLSLTMALGIAHVQMTPALLAIARAPLITYAVFCWLCWWCFRAIGIEKGPDLSI